MELGDGPRLPGLVVLEVEGPHQVVLAPHVLGHQVDLRLRIFDTGMGNRDTCTRVPQICDIVLIPPRASICGKVGSRSLIVCTK